jgi:hypothetical protein
MPPDYIQVPPNNATTKLNERPRTSGGNDMGVALSRAVLAQAIALREQLLKLVREFESSFKQRATGSTPPVSPDLPKLQKTSNLQVEVNAIVRHYQYNLHQVPDLASTLKPPTENFSQLIEAATGGRSTNVFHVVRIDPRSFDFADLLMFAYDRGWSYDRGREVYQVTSTISDRHRPFSFHYDGRAIDIGAAGLSPTQKSYIENEFARVGVRLYDETIEKNKTPETSGPCLHFDTATGRELMERKQVGLRKGTRIDLGVGDGWPARRP